jgi:hypothetical protein
LPTRDHQLGKLANKSVPRIGRSYADGYQHIPRTIKIDKMIGKLGNLLMFLAAVSGRTSGLLAWANRQTQVRPRLQAPLPAPGSKLAPHFRVW